MAEKTNDFFTDVLVNLIYYDKNFEYEAGIDRDIDCPARRRRKWFQNYLTSLLFSLFLGCFAVFISMGGLTSDQKEGGKFFSELPPKIGVSDPPDDFDKKDNKNVTDAKFQVKDFDAWDILIGQNIFPGLGKKAPVIVKRELKTVASATITKEPKIRE